MYCFRIVAIYCWCSPGENTLYEDNLSSPFSSLLYVFYIELTTVQKIVLWTQKKTFKVSDRREKKQKGNLGKM